MFGYFEGDEARVDTILRRAGEMTVRDHLESIRGVNCYVIDGATSRGKYTIWLDPVHGYNIAEAVVSRRGGDDWDRVAPVPEGCSFRYFLAVLQFRQFDGVWVPVEAEMVNTRRFENGDHAREIRRYEVKAFIRCPDHDALGSFLADDIRDGAAVHLLGHRANGATYRWYRGKVVPEPSI
jgi:hypothetical protein